ncbi:transposase-like protein [Paraburkholderia sp. GAS448]
MPQWSFERQLVGKYQRRLPGFDDHVISMYARGMSVREIQGHLLELYGLQVSPDLISTVTDEVLAEVEQWQQRPLEAMYPIVYFDALRLKIRDEGTVKNKAVYLALGIRADGRKDIRKKLRRLRVFALYTTNAIESMHMQLRKIVKNRGHFPSDEAASKLLYLALRNIEKDWKMPPITWRQAVNQFAILFGERFTSAID